MSVQGQSLREALASAAAVRLPELDWGTIRLLPADFDSDFGYARGAGVSIALAELQTAVTVGRTPPGIILLGLAADQEILAGASRTVSIQTLAAWPGFRYLRMPFTVEALDEAARAVLAGRSAPPPAVTIDEVALKAAGILHWFVRIVHSEVGAAMNWADVVRGELDVPRRKQDPGPLLLPWQRDELNRLQAGLLLCTGLADSAQLADGLETAIAGVDAAGNLFEHKRAAMLADPRHPDQATLIDLAAAAKMLADQVKALLDRISEIGSKAVEGAGKEG